MQVFNNYVYLALYGKSWQFVNKLQGNEINIGSDEKLKSFFKKKMNNDNKTSHA